VEVCKACDDVPSEGAEEVCKACDDVPSEGAEEVCKACYDVPSEGAEEVCKACDDVPSEGAEEVSKRKLLVVCFWFGLLLPAYPRLFLDHRHAAPSAPTARYSGSSRLTHTPFRRWRASCTAATRNASVGSLCIERTLAAGRLSLRFTSTSTAAPAIRRP
jgi:hypothetical protein